eukprot:Rmarinus@m.2250
MASESVGSINSVVLKKSEVGRLVNRLYTMHGCGREQPAGVVKEQMSAPAAAPRVLRTKDDEEAMVNRLLSSAEDRDSRIAEKQRKQLERERASLRPTPQLSQHSRDLADQRRKQYGDSPSFLDRVEVELKRSESLKEELRRQYEKKLEEEMQPFVSSVKKTNSASRIPVYAATHSASSANARGPSSHHRRSTSEGASAQKPAQAKKRLSFSSSSDDDGDFVEKTHPARTESAGTSPVTSARAPSRPDNDACSSSSTSSSSIDFAPYWSARSGQSNATLRGALARQNRCTSPPSSVRSEPVCAPVRRIDSSSMPTSSHTAKPTRLASPSTLVSRRSKSGLRDGDPTPGDWERSLRSPSVAETPAEKHRQRERSHPGLGTPGARAQKHPESISGDHASRLSAENAHLREKLSSIRRNSRSKSKAFREEISKLRDRVQYLEGLLDSTNTTYSPMPFADVSSRESPQVSDPRQYDLLFSSDDDSIFAAVLQPNRSASKPTTGSQLTPATGPTSTDNSCRQAVGADKEAIDGDPDAAGAALTALSMDMRYAFGTSFPRKALTAAMMPDSQA